MPRSGFRRKHGRDSEYYDIVSDRIGRPVLVLDADRNEVWSAKYSPYGIIYDETGSLAGEFNLRAPGQYHDRETGFYYNGQRYYIPEMVRYNSPEPIGQAVSLNLYMYAGGDPVNMIDQTGLADFDVSEVADAPPPTLKQGADLAALAVSFAPDVGDTMDAGELVYDLASGDYRGAAVSAAAMVLPGVSARALKTVGNIAKSADEVGEAASAAARKGETPGKLPEGAGVDGGGGTKAAVKEGTVQETGSYTNIHESGKRYHGKGDKARSQESGKRIEKETEDRHIATDWTPAKNEREAFKQESRRLDADEGGPKSPDNYNKIESPGKKYRIQDGEIPSSDSLEEVDNGQ